MGRNDADEFGRRGFFFYEACFKGEIVFGTVAKSSLKQEDCVQSNENNFTYPILLFSIMVEENSLQGMLEERTLGKRWCWCSALVRDGEVTTLHVVLDATFVACNLLHRRVARGREGGPYGSSEGELEERKGVWEEQILFTWELFYYFLRGVFFLWCFRGRKAKGMYYFFCYLAKNTASHICAHRVS